MIEEALQISISGDSAPLQRSLKDLGNDLKKFKQQLLESTDPTAISNLATEAKKTADAINNIKKSYGIDALQKQLKSVTPVQMQFSQLLRETPALAINANTFILAISNNLPLFTDALKAARAEGKGFGTILKEIGGSFVSFSGIATIAIAAFTIFGDKIFGSGKKAEKAADDIKNAAEAIGKAGTEFVTASGNVSRLTQEIDLAKQGLISKEGVLKDYNETIGKTTGQVKTLEQAEKALAKNADAYVQMTLYKAAANQALEEAAKKAFEAAKIENIDVNKAVGQYKDLGNLLGIGQQQAAQVAEAYKKQKVAEAQKKVDTLEDIAKQFQAKAAEISKKYSFNFFGDTKTDTGKEPKNVPKFDFFGKRFEVNPKTIQEKADKAADMYTAAVEFALQNTKNFEGLDPIIKAIGNQDKVIAEGKKFWDNYTNGLIKFKPQAFDVNAVINVIPEVKDNTNSIVEQFRSSLQSGLREGLNTPLALPDKALLKTFDDYRSRFKEIGFKMPDIDINIPDFSKKMDDTLTKIKSVTDAIKDGLTPAFQSMFSSILSGGNALQSFAQSLLASFKSLISQLLAHAAIAGIISALVPGAGSFTEVLKTFGGLFKSLPGHAKGLWEVPSGYNNDSYLSRLSSGEMVLPRNIADAFRNGSLFRAPTPRASTSPNTSGIKAPVFTFSGPERIELFGRGPNIYGSLRLAGAKIGRTT
jgi:hypothetical protein